MAVTGPMAQLRRRKLSKNQQSALFPTPDYKTKPVLAGLFSQDQGVPQAQSPVVPYGGILEDFQRRVGGFGGDVSAALAGAGQVPTIFDPRSAQASFMAFAGMPGGGGPLAAAPASPTADAARLLAGAFEGNPFMSIPGLARMQQGYAPLLSEIDPALWETTSPTIRAALAGLYQSMNLRPEDVEHTFRQWQPPSIFG